MSGRAEPRRFKFGADRRIASTGDFERLLREGRREAFSGFTMYHAPRAEGPPRLGMLVTKRHAKRATDRNSIKRCIREAFRLEQAALGSMDVLVRPAYGVKPGARMLARLRPLFSKLTR